jgi:hypothetical protein
MFENTNYKSASLPLIACRVCEPAAFPFPLNVRGKEEEEEEEEMFGEMKIGG